MPSAKQSTKELKERMERAVLSLQRDEQGNRRKPSESQKAKAFWAMRAALAYGSKRLVSSRVDCNGLQLSGYQDFAKDVGRALLGRRLDPWDSVRLRTASTCWSVPRKYAPHGELFFFRIKKEPVASNEVSSNPFVSAETLNACAPIGLHLLAAGGEEGPVLSCEPGMEPGPVVVNLLI